MTEFPKLKNGQAWGCGQCGGENISPKESAFEYSREEFPNGDVISKTSKVYVSACCEAELMLWDESKQDFIDNWQAAPLPTVAPTPVPEGVYYCIEARSFYEFNHEPMGIDFNDQWRDRSPEFPTAPLTVGNASDAPLIGRWHHGNGNLVCGTIRIAREDFDTNPCEEFKEEVFEWICNTLNAGNGSTVLAPVAARGDAGEVPVCWCNGEKLKDGCALFDTEWEQTPYYDTPLFAAPVVNQSLTAAPDLAGERERLEELLDRALNQMSPDSALRLLNRHLDALASRPQVSAPKEKS